MRALIDFCDPHAQAHASASAGSAGQRWRFEQPLQVLLAWQVQQVQPLLAQLQQQAQQGRWCVGYIRYEAASAFDSALQTHPADGPLACFGVFSEALPWLDARAGPSPINDDTPLRWQPGLTRAEFDATMAHIAQAIAAGELYQVNYTAPWLGRFEGQADALFARLLQAQPGGYSAMIDSGFEQVLSVSPELFFDWQAPHILTRPMKGTAPRSDDAGTDAALAHALTESAKERAENVMIVDLLRNDLSRIAQPHSVRVPRLFQVHSLPTVHQMVSDVTALTRPGCTLGEVFAALFPCGSITGAPKVRAMQMIRSIEAQPRGVYCGSIGVLRPGGHATFNVAIRTVTLHQGQARCGIGSGITADAVAPAEWQEWRYKRRFLQRAAQPFQLLETLRLQGGHFHLLEMHLARLQRAAQHFGYTCDLEQVQEALRTLQGGVQARGDAPDSAWRVRIALAADGTVTLQHSELNMPQSPVNIALAATSFEAFESEFCHFKTTHRAHYEAFTPTDPTLFDTVLYNPRGELTECTRGNIAVQIDGQWLTPARSCGLLAGVGRQQALQQGRLQEAVLTLSDLPRVQGWAFLNSLRGWLTARLVPPVN